MCQYQGQYLSKQRDITSKRSSYSHSAFLACMFHVTFQGKNKVKQRRKQKTHYFPPFDTQVSGKLPFYSTCSLENTVRRITFGFSSAAEKKRKMSKDFFISVLRSRSLFLGSVFDPLGDLGGRPNPLNHSITRSKKAFQGFLWPPRKSWHLSRKKGKGCISVTVSKK